MDTSRSGASAAPPRATGHAASGSSPIKHPKPPEAVIRRSTKRGLTVEQVFADPAPPRTFRGAAARAAAAEAGRGDGDASASPPRSGAAGPGPGASASGRSEVVLLTPRSAEACLREGVNPDDLRLRDVDWFWEPGMDPALQRMRHEAYSRLRHDKARAVRRARAAIVAERRAAGGAGRGGKGGRGGRRGSRSSARSGDGGSVSGGRGLTSSRSSGAADDLLALERRRLARVCMPIRLGSWSRC